MVGRSGRPRIFAAPSWRARELDAPGQERLVWRRRAQLPGRVDERLLEQELGLAQVSRDREAGAPEREATGVDELQQRGKIASLRRAQKFGVPAGFGPGPGR